MTDVCKKILYTASTDGHLRSFHLPVLRALTQAGHDVTAAASGDGQGLGVRFVPVPFTKRFVSVKNFSAAAALAKLIRKERFDIVLTHTSLAAFFTRFGILLAGKKNTRVVNTVHGYLFDDETPFLRRAVLLGAERLMSCVTDDILTMNRQDTKIAQKYRLCRGHIAQIDGMGVELSRFSPASRAEKVAARRALGLPEGAFVLVYAAEFSARKNQQFLIGALPRLPENVWLVLPGRGALLEDCRALAERLGVSGRVVFPGYADDVAVCYHAADACVSSSRSEGLPFNLIEGMSCGLPAIATRVKGNEDLIFDGETGSLFPFGDSAALRECVEKLLSDPTSLSAMGEKARAGVQKYDLQNVLPTVLPWYVGTAMRRSVSG